MNTAKNYLSLGESFEEKGKYFKAERLYKKALRAVESQEPQDNEAFIDCLYNLGMVQAALDKNIDSIDNLERLLSHLSETRPHTDPDLLEVRATIEDLYPELSLKAVNS